MCICVLLTSVLYLKLVNYETTQKKRKFREVVLARLAFFYEKVSQRRRRRRRRERRAESTLSPVPRVRCVAVAFSSVQVALWQVESGGKWHCGKYEQVGRGLPATVNRCMDAFESRTANTRRTDYTKNDSPRGVFEHGPSFFPRNSRNLPFSCRFRRTRFD